MNISAARFQQFLAGCLVALGIGGATVQAQPIETTQPAEQQQPLLVTGDRFDTDRQKGTYTYSGNVQFQWQDLNAFCDKLISYGTLLEIEKAELLGNVRILTQDITATADKAIYALNNQNMELEGKARIVQGKNVITAHRLILFTETSSLEGYGDSETAERVIMTVYSSEPSETTPPEPAVAPMTVESDTLKYDNDGRIAVFTGSVRTQKDLAEILADEMTVYLSGAEGTTDTEIEKIGLSGHVRIVQDTATITGAQGEYHYRDQTIRMEGNAEEQALLEDRSQNTRLRADWFTFFVATSDIKAENATITIIPPETKPAEPK